jgi:hypothetical protein
MRNKCMTRNLNCPWLHKIHDITIYAQKNLVRKDGKLRWWKRTLMPNRHENSRRKKLHQNDDDGKLTDDDNNFPSASAIRRLKCWNVETCRGFAVLTELPVHLLVSRHTATCFRHTAGQPHSYHNDKNSTVLDQWQILLALTQNVTWNDLKYITLI